MMILARRGRLLLESLRLWSDIRDKVHLSRVCIFLAETALWEGKLAEAGQWLAQCLAYGVDARRLGFALVNGLYVAARLGAVLQNYQQAATLFGMAEALRISTHYTLVEPVRSQIDNAVSTVRKGLTADVFAENFAAGRMLPISMSSLRLYTIESSTILAFSE